jgi:hypothetical protein
VHSISKKALRAQSLILLRNLPIDVWPVVNEIAHVNGDSAVRWIGFRLLVTSLAFSDFCCTVAYGITNLYTKSMSLYRFFILCILYLLFAWFHVSNDKGTFPLCVDIFFSHRPAFYRTSLYIRVTPLGFWWSSCYSSLVFLSSCCVFCVECCQCLCIVHSWLPLLCLSIFFYHEFFCYFIRSIYVCCFLNSPNLLMSDILNVSSITVKSIAVRCGTIRRVHFLTRNIKVTMTGRGPRNEYGTKEPFPETF